LAPSEKRLIPEFLWHGPEAHGFRGEYWNCNWVALVLEEEFGVQYHPGPTLATEGLAEIDPPSLESAERLFSWMNQAFACCLRL
jgi:hypothetical protein